MASIRKLPSGNYQVQIRLVGMPPVCRSFAKKRDADAFVREVAGNTELQRKLGRAAAHIPIFSDWVSTFLKAYEGRDPDMAGKLAWWAEQFPGIAVTKIDEFMVDEALARLQKHGRHGDKPMPCDANGKPIRRIGGRRGVSGSTVNRYKSALSSCLRAFISHSDYKRAGFSNPVRKESVETFKENRPKDRFLTGEEQTALLEASRKSAWDRMHLLVLLALTTGARRGELLQLRWSDIDFAQRTASLERTKNGKPRLLPLTKPVIEQLMRFREKNNTLIFPSSVSKNQPFAFRHHWYEGTAEAGLHNLRFHDLRHTAASNLVRAGRSLFEVGVLLGHSSTQMTKRYSHLAIHDTRNMVDEVMGGLK